MSTATETSWKADDNPDRFGEELGDEAHIWRVYKDVADADDKNRVDNWNRGLDNLALFAGLLSAVTSAFLIEARNDLTPDPILETLRSIDARLYNRTYIPDAPGAPADARAVNLFWVASLIFSLTAALIAIMGKDWIGMYVKMPSCTLRERADIRTFRLRCVEQWHMSGVISSAPVLLHISLLLFGAGLVVFMALDLATLIFASLVSGLIFVLYLFIIVHATVSPMSPFQSPATQALRRLLILRGHEHSPQPIVAPAVSEPSAQEVAQPAIRNKLWPPAWMTRKKPIDEETARSAGSVQQQAPGAEPSPLSETIGTPPVLSHWNAIPAVHPDRMLQSLMWLRAASPHAWVERAIITALGDQTIVRETGDAIPLRDRTSLDVPMDDILGYRVTHCLSGGYFQAARLHKQEVLLRQSFRERLPTTIDWSRADLLAVLRYIRLRNNQPDAGMADPEDTQLDALFRDALLEDRVTPEQYIYVVCLAVNRRGLTIDLSKVQKHCEHIDLALTTASFLMTLLAASEPSFDALLVMTKCFGWHRRPAYAPMFPTVLQRHLHLPASDPSGYALASRTSSGVELLSHIIRHRVRAAFSEGVDILHDLLALPSGKYGFLFDLIDREKSPAASQAIWTICQESPTHALRLMHALPHEELDVPNGQAAYMERLTRNVMVLALSWLVPPAQQLPTLQSRCRAMIISEIDRGTRTAHARTNTLGRIESGDIDTPAPDTGANAAIGAVLSYSALTHPSAPADCDWELLAAIAAYLTRRLETPLPDAEDKDERSNAESELQVVMSLVKLFNAVGSNVGGRETGDGNAFCNLGRLLFDLSARVAFSAHIARFLRELRQVCDKPLFREIVAAYPGNKNLIDRWTTIDQGELSFLQIRPHASGSCEVYRAAFRGVTVAVKKWRYTEDESRDCILDAAASTECSRLVTLHHENIILFMGVTIDHYGHRCPVFAWAEYNNVRRYTTNCPGADRVQLILGVARGIAHLHSRNPQILHMNVYPPHILVNSTGRAMLGGFSRSIMLPEEKYTARMWRQSRGGQGPQSQVPYIAPEMWEEGEEDGHCSSALDVFAWAMSALEILSGVQPLYGPSRTATEIESLVREGTRPVQEDHSKNLESDAAELLGRCWPLLERGWAHDPNERPSMEQIVEELTRIKDERSQESASQRSSSADSTSGTE